MVANENRVHGHQGLGIVLIRKTCQYEIMEINEFHSYRDRPLHSRPVRLTRDEVETDVDDENEIRDQIENDYVRRLEAAEIRDAYRDHDEVDYGHDDNHQLPIHSVIAKRKIDVRTLDS